MRTNLDNHNLLSGFAEAARYHKQRPALFINGKHFSYDTLAQVCSNISLTITELEPPSKNLVAILAHRSLTAYAGVLGILASGRGYVPLNPKFPIARTRKMLLESGSSVILVGQECLPQIRDLLSDLRVPLTVILPEVSDGNDLKSQFPDHCFFPANSLPSGPSTLSVPFTPDDAIAYLMFTSGSTGSPKGVPVSHRNARSYIEYITDRYDVHCEDRISQTFDLTFDLSVHDLFVTWERGACLYCVPDALGMAPAKFIRDQELTFWFSVPSVVGFLARLRLLRPGLFPTLRYSLFCGEALPEKSVLAWQCAAPNSAIENLYGPTEATIAITGYRWDPVLSPNLCRNGIVPIGWSFNGQNACVVKSDMRSAAPGEPGELLVSGPQVTAGYWKDPEKTREKYVQLPEGDGLTWYRTGDQVMKGEGGCLIYLGRIDDQVKIRGFRAELQEVDFVLREASNSEQAVSVAWPVHDGSADGVVAFVCGASDQDREAIMEHCRKSLPDYMVPREVYFIDEMPRNPNGKFDRRKLISWLERNAK